MSGIFICDRRADSAGWAGRLYDRLTAAWEDDEVFWDIDDIGPGADFREAIERTLQKCDIVLAVIGEH